MKTKHGAELKKLAILKRTEGTMLRAKYGIKLMCRKNTSELMIMLGLTAAMEMSAKAIAMRWFEHVLRTKEDNAVRMALSFQVKGKKKERS